SRLRYAAHAPVRNGLPAGVSLTLRIMSAAPHSHGLHADVSVRPSVPEDAVHLGRIQVAAWQKAFAGVLPAAVLAGLEEHTFAEDWLLAVYSTSRAYLCMLYSSCGP